MYRQVEDSLRPLQEALEVDGGTLRVAGLEGGVLSLTLSLAPDACQDCIVPDEMLVSMVLAQLRELDPAVVEHVEIAHVDAASSADAE